MMEENSPKIQDFGHARDPGSDESEAQQSVVCTVVV